MELGLQIPRQALPYILYQRTAYQTFAKTFPIRPVVNLIPWPTYHWVLQLEAVLRGKRIRELFRRGVSGDFESIRSGLPAEAQVVLDIGCGLGGLDVLLYRHFGAPELFLLDKSHIDKGVHYGYGGTGAFYHSFDVTEAFLRANGLSMDKVRFLEADSELLRHGRVRFDLVVSLLAWGYHFPVSMYDEQVYVCLKDGGHLILDVRRDTGGVEQLTRRYHIEGVLVDRPDRERILAVKRPP